jgi:hypothetical protein
MVEVDVFWSYGLGATLAVASSRQLLARRQAATAARQKAADAPVGEPRHQDGELLVGPPAHSRWRDPYLLRTLLFLALIFAPSGAYLVWAFPSWETMHVGTRDMPAWLIATFAITNVTQGLLGFYVVERLLAAGRSYLAYLQILVGYVGMFFILVHGWDGKGYERFFSPTHSEFVHWHGHWTAWLTSDVSFTLIGMGVILVPVLLGTVAAWQREGYRLAPAGTPRPGVVKIIALTLSTVFVVGLGLSVGAHAVIRALGAGLGVPAAIVLVALALLRGGPVHALYRAYGLPGAAEAGRPLPFRRASAAGARA